MVKSWNENILNVSFSNLKNCREIIPNVNSSNIKSLNVKSPKLKSPVSKTT